jgi:hypothetical protein
MSRDVIMSDARMRSAAGSGRSRTSANAAGRARCELFAEHGVGRGHNAACRRPRRRRDRHAVSVCLYEGGATDHGAEPEFAAAIDTGLAAAAVTARRGPLEGHRAHPSGGRVCVSRSRTDAPICTSSSSGILQALPTRGTRPLSPTQGRHRAPADTRRAHRRPDAATLARVITAIIHISTTATVYLDRGDDAVLSDIREQVQAN